MFDSFRRTGAKPIAIAAGIAGSLFLGGHSAEAQEIAAAAVTSPDTTAQLKTIVVSAQRLKLLGTASTASEGVVSDEEIQLAPAFRPGQVLETVPGLAVASHSGEGKANQYLLRGYNLDHGTDLATFVDGMPVNQPTHAHGQGYTDLNFLIPELADRLSYTKGPYYAGEGDFASVGSVHLEYRDEMAPQVTTTTGTLGYQRLFAGGSRALAGGSLLGALELQHYDGPWDVGDDARKENAVLRYSHGDDGRGYSVTGMYYHQLWTNTTDIPQRAIDQGLVPDQYGSLNPSDGGRAQRFSLSSLYHQSIGAGRFEAGAYYIGNHLDMWHDFTHFLVDPDNGDQEDQHENRDVLGANAQFTLPFELLSFDNEFVTGVQTRYDSNQVSRLPSLKRIPLPVDKDPTTFSEDDRVNLYSGALFIQATTHWTPWFHSILGVREDYQHGADTDHLADFHGSDPDAPFSNSGKASKSLFQPKGSLIFTPSSNAEFYISAGRGFHSDDLRGVTRDQNTGQPGAALLASQFGEELGARINVQRNLALTVALFNLDAQSETTYDADAGQDSAGPSSRRYGYEVNLTYKPRRWLEIYGSFSEDHAHYKTPTDDGTGHVGTFLPNAPFATGSLALYLTNLGPWSGGLVYRYLGNFPLTSGACSDAAVAQDFPTASGPPLTCANAPTAHGQVNGKGYGEFNLDVHYAFDSGWGAALGVYNLLNTKRDAMQYYYVDRLPGEAAYGQADTHVHPLEPVSARLTLSKTFGGT